MSKAVDRWTLGHFCLGLFLGFTMKSLVFVLAFLVAWELYELLFRPDVKEALSNRIVDLIVGMLGALLSQLVFQGVLA
jgi:Co/Zn/Cd efflux system component